MVHAAFVFDAIRTPRGKGKPDGSLHEVRPISLVSHLLGHLRERNSLDTQLVDDIVLGCVTPIGEQGGNLPKMAALSAGWHERVAGQQINRFCASGLEAVNLAAMKVASGFEDLVVAGGVESMSRVPMGSDGGAAYDPAWSAQVGFVPQGIGADLIATIGGFNRRDVDRFAVGSQQKAAAARDGGYFSKSVVPVTDECGLPILDQDEFIKPHTTMEELARLKPSFEGMGRAGMDAVALARYPKVAAIDHVHTPGNSSGIVDGAALVLVGSEQAGRKLGLVPRARVVSVAITGTEPTIMLTGPAPAAFKALDKAGMTLDQIDLFEVNEAFASVVLRFQADTGVPWEKINVNGGAIAMGHPLGATGEMLIGTMIDVLERRQLGYGLCALCVGGGIGLATTVERN